MQKFCVGLGLDSGFGICSTLSRTINTCILRLLMLDDMLNRMKSLVEFDRFWVLQHRFYQAPR